MEAGVVATTDKVTRQTGVYYTGLHLTLSTKGDGDAVGRDMYC